MRGYMTDIIWNVSWSKNDLWLQGLKAAPIELKDLLLQQ